MTGMEVRAKALELACMLPMMPEREIEILKIAKAFEKYISGDTGINKDKQW